MKKSILLIGILLLLLPEAEAIDINATGGWTETIDAADLTAGAGSDLTTTYTSATNATLITIINCTGSTDNWRVDVRRLDINWSASFTLRVRRTNTGTAGSGGGSCCTGGGSFMNITTTDQTFFSGRGNRNNVACRYRLLGMSINIPPATYSTTVIYTIVDT